MSHNIFAYGTLMLPQVLEALTGNLFIPKAATLNGYSRYVFKGKCYPGIIEDKKGIVEGVLYSDIDDRTLSIMDWFEKVLYDRHLLTVHVENESILAYTYVVPDNHQKKLDHLSWSLEKFIEEYSETYIKKCFGYRKQWQKNKASFD
jgi:gamma-glutamylcyclotransferase (GGCT)/AIG2-like uncharacterized protein YtfP